MLEAGLGGDPIDDKAVRLGYEMYRRFPSGMTSQQYYETIIDAHLTD